MKAFFEAESPFAYQDMTGRMMEDDSKRVLGSRSRDAGPIAHGVRRECEHSRSRLRGAHLRESSAPGVRARPSSHCEIPAVDLEAFQQALEQALGVDIETAARAAEAFVRRNEAESIMSENLQGIRMEESVSELETFPAVPVSDRLGDSERAALWVGLPVLGLLVAWRVWQRRGRGRQ